MEQEVETVVIGAGFAGLSAALYAARRGEHVVVLEKGTGKESASFASTAEMNHDPDVDWDGVIKRFGLEAAQRIWQLTERAMDDLAHFSKSSGAPAFETKRLPAHLFAYEEKDILHIEQKFERYRSLGARVSLSAGLHPSFMRSLTIENEGRTNNQALLKALQHTLRSVGGKIMRGMDVVAITGSGPYTLTCAGGRTLKARNVHVATGDGAGLVEGISVSRVRTFVVRYESAELPQLFRDSLMWDVHEPFHYIRSFRGRQLWVGGEDTLDHNVTNEREAQALRALEHFTRDVLKLPENMRMTGSWGGTFFPTDRSLPYIGTDARGVRVSVGFGGSGLLMSYISGYLHEAWMRGVDLEYRDLFALDW